ncbi:MAG: excinuclease ABC subunit UvrA [Planctomycetota bacterium]
MQREIRVRGAREHNLRDVDLTLTRGELICFSGVSGSGKSSLAFDTLFAEGQRRYVQSLSNSARQFMGQMPKPDVDLVSGLSPSISISQKSTGSNPRSTVGTITEIADFLRVLFARVGTGHCPACDQVITAQTADAIIGRIMHLAGVDSDDPNVVESGQATLWILAPLVRGQKGEFKDLFEDLRKQGFNRARVDGETIRLADPPSLDRTRRHDVEVVIDRVETIAMDRGRIGDAVALGLKLGEATLIVSVCPADSDWIGDAKQDRLFSSRYACGGCGRSFRPPTPQLFSFNSPQGMCTACDGIGRLYTFVPDLLIPDPSKSVRRGAIMLLGKWGDLGRYRRHIYKGVAEAIDESLELPAGTMLEGKWRDLPEQARKIWLWGADESMEFVWRGGRRAKKYVGNFDGFIPELLDRYRTSRNKMQLKQFEKFMQTIDCPDCEGRRLNAQASAVKITTRSKSFGDAASMTLPELCALPVERLADFFCDIELSPTDLRIATEALKEIRGRIGFLLGVGLDYLTLARTAPTLSGGESQRIRLAGQIGSALSGVLYILDEPSIGLHSRDNDRLIETLTRLRDAGNTLIVVEHDEETMRAADRIVDFGPGPGVKGGHIVAEGDVEAVAAVPDSVTGAFLSGRRTIQPREPLRPINSDRQLHVLGARHHNLRSIDVSIPLGVVICVTGVSGSGKSSLIGGIVAPALRRDLNGAESEPGDHDRLDGIRWLDKAITIDQSPIGRTPRSNPATYVKVFDEIRSLFAKLPDAKTRGYSSGRFSFNVDGGRCAGCDGNGATKLEMDFLADVWVTCTVCQGKRYNRETLSVKFKGCTIADVLQMDISEALQLFENIPKIAEKLQTLVDVGLEYLQLGQPSPTLSGGEAQRIKLAKELSRRDTGNTLYILDEPTTGLHFADIELLLGVINRLADRGNTIVIVEHNLDVIKTADWVIDLGVEGGAGGGTVVAEGRPADVAKVPASYTGAALAKAMGIRRARIKKRAKAIRDVVIPPAKSRTHVVVEGAREHNLKSVDVEIPRDAMSVFCGPSGSGKSSLAMDTIYAEGQRRYVESLSSYARQFIGQVQKPKAERIEGLSPAIALEQKNLGHSPRSTVGTVTEVYDYLRILFAKLGTMHCPDCECEVGTQTPDQIIDKVMAMPSGTRAMLMAPIEVAGGEASLSTWASLRQSGYSRVRVNGSTRDLDDAKPLDPRRNHDVQVVVDRVVIQTEELSRISDSIEQALSLGVGVVNVAIADADQDEKDWSTFTHSQHRVCPSCDRSFVPLTPHHFSFNSAVGWCSGCEGLGTQKGTNPAALMGTPQQTLLDGGALLWPSMDHAVSRWMLRALSRTTGIPSERPLESLTTTHKRLLFHGTGSRWIEVRKSDTDATKSSEAFVGGADGILFRYQFKGFYPALEEASRLTPGLRGKLEQFVSEIDCSQCSGSRLRDDSSAVRFRGHTLGDLVQMPLDRFAMTVDQWQLNSREETVAGEVSREIQSRIQFLRDVGLGYLTLHRGAATLSGGEAQRIRLASQLGSGLCGVLYVLDEPTIGLHPRDNQRLLSALHRLRDLGNTLLVVEHDHEVIAGSDHLFDFGPAAGHLGGRIVASGEPNDVQPETQSVTAPYLQFDRQIEMPTSRRPVLSPSGKPMVECLRIRGARENNLQNVDVEFPLGVMTAVTGPSGSGKSSLVNDILYPVLARRLHRARVRPGRHDSVDGLRYVNKVIRVDQSPLGNSPSSNPATYTGVFDLIRTLFAGLPDAAERRFTPRTFSFNVSGGRCESCEGSGQRKIEMHFLPDVWVQCEDCLGRRYNEDVLEVKLHGRSIADVLEMSCGEACDLFANHSKILRIVQTLCDVGLDYVTLGQTAPTLSGGEAQRVKLAAELARPATGHTVFLLDEPTTGLHFGDIEKLLDVMQRLVDLGNSVIVIEHNLDVVKCADWVIDIGPDAGAAGGQVVYAGTPDGLATSKGVDSPTRSVTAPYLAAAMSRHGQAMPGSAANGAARKRQQTPPSHQPASRNSTTKHRDNAESLGAATESEWPLEGSSDAAPMPQPWKALGRRWHTLPKGFPDGDSPRWSLQLVEEILQMLSSVAGDGAIDYPAPDRVAVRLEADATSTDLPHWAELETKKPQHLRLHLRGPRTAIDLEQLFALDVILGDGDSGAVDLSDSNSVRLTLHFKDVRQANSRKLRTFLKTHLDRTRLQT